MCPPAHFEVAYEINPWMHNEVHPDPERAQAQWERLVAALRSAGAEVETMDPVPGLPDLVFTANAGLVDGDRFIPSRFRHPERRGETDHDVAWFSRRGYRVAWLPEAVLHEGAGDALPFGGHGPNPPTLLSGYRFRSDAASHAEVSRITGAPVRPLELADPRLYHLDLVFCPLDDRRAMVAPLGLDRYGLKVVESLVPELLYLEDEEALGFCANSVVVGDRIVMPGCPARVGDRLRSWGFEVEVCPVDEFLKAGGGCRCLTLALDVRLGVEARGGPA
ncbi:MAG TPA: arginine deiminase-related protein [Acidimicrobiales bacterium]|nr:arginine deiminase-related protein [Acidimicrobiales bacterium]